MAFTIGTDSATATLTTDFLWVAPHRRCIVKPRSNRGTNQHALRQYGECEECGAKFVRRVDWKRRSDSWWKRIRGSAESNG